MLNSIIFGKIIELKNNGKEKYGRLLSDVYYKVMFDNFGDFIKERNQSFKDILLMFVEDWMSGIQQSNSIHRPVGIWLPEHDKLDDLGIESAYGQLLSA